jgi:tape measure domain-containing protein
MSEKSELDIILRLKDEMSGKLSGASSAIGKIGNQLTNLGSMAVKAFSLASAGATAFAGMSLKTAGQLEAAEAGFRALLGSADKAGEVMNRIKEEAKATPFELTGLVTGTQALTAITKDGNQAIDILLDVGKAIATSGKGSAEMDRVILNLQQIASTGKITAMDIRQFQGAIPIFNDIIEANGLTVESLQNSENAAEELFEAFKKAGEEGGMTAGGYTEMAGTFNQLWSNVIDTVTIFGTEFVKQTGIFDLVKNAFAGFIQFFENNKETIINWFNNTIQAFKNFGAVAWTYIEPVYLKMKEFLSDLENRKAVIVGVLAVLTTAFSAWAISVIISVGPILLIMAAIGTAAALLYKIWTENFWGIQEKTRAVFQAIVSIYNQYIVPLWETWKKEMTEALNAWKSNWDAIKGIFEGVWQAIIGIFQVVWGTFSGLYKIFLSVFMGDWKKAWEAVKETFSTVFKGIYNIGAGIFRALISAMASMVNGAITLLNRLISSMNKIPGVNVKEVGKIKTSDLLSYIPTLAVGTNYVPNDTLAFLHKGEAVVPKQYNPSAGGAGGIIINITGDNIFNRESDMDLLVEKISNVLSREQEKAQWGIG